MSKSIISKKILFWYDNNKRILPWRKNTSKEQKLYFTLVSEFMLQQTQVSTVIPYFKRFVQKIPNFKKLSKANDQTLMKLWEGLGYYSRARNLKKSAIMINGKFGGILPSNFEDLKSFTTDLIKNQMQQYGQAIPDEKELDGIVARVMSNKDEIKRLTEQLTSSRILNFFKDNFNYKLKKVSYDEYLKEAYPS